MRNLWSYLLPHILAIPAYASAPAMTCQAILQQQSSPAVESTHEYVASRDLFALITNNPSQDQVQQLIETMHLPQLLKDFLLEGFVSEWALAKKSQPNHYAVLYDQWRSSGFQSLIYSLGTTYFAKHPDVARNPDLPREILGSDLTDAYKWLIIDGLLKTKTISAWPEGPLLNPIEQLLYFETQANPIGARTTMEIPFPTKFVSPQQVRVLRTGALPEAIRKLFFMNDGRVRIPVHPVVFNAKNSESGTLRRTAGQIPYVQEPTEEYQMGKLTASRSTFFSGVSVKMPTQYPRANDDFNRNWNKLNVQQDVIESLPRTRLIEAINQRLGADPRLLLLTDIMALVDSQTKNAYLIRDTSPLMDGHHYMPGFGTWGPGKVIAERLGTDFESYWLQHYAYSYGRSKALLLIRYGLAMENSHDQQWLMQMRFSKAYDTLIPTDVNVIRDLGDTLLVQPIARTIAESFLNEDRHTQRPVYKEFKDSTLLNLQKIPLLTASKWHQVHAQGIRDTIEQELGIKLPQNWNTESYLSSQELEAALRRYHHLPPH